MSWAIEAIEREAMARATRTVLQSDPTVFGMDASQYGALRQFFIETVKLDPAECSAERILAELRERLVCR